MDGLVIDARAVTLAVTGSTALAGARILAIMPSIALQGMERANLQIMTMLRARGADVLFVIERNHGHLVTREVERIGCPWAGVALLDSFEERLHLTWRPAEMARVTRAWLGAAWQIDAIYRAYAPTHVYVTALSFALYALPTLWRSTPPVIFRLPNPPDTTLGGAKGRLSRWLWRFAVAPACDTLVCNSRYTLRQLQAVGVDVTTARVIHNCVAERASDGPSDAPRLRPDRFNVVYLGRISAAKGVRELVDAATRLVHEHPDVDFCLAGEYAWKNPFADALMESVRRQGLASRIRFAGQIQDVFGLLSQAHLHVLPSTSAAESFSNAVLEAKSAAIPSVVFPTSGLPEAVTHTVDGFVCREASVAALYEGLRYFLDDPAALKAAGEAARRSLERFSPDRIAGEWVTVFR